MYSIDYSNQNVKQDLLTTVGPGTIIVRDAPDNDLSGLNRNLERVETICHYSFTAHSKAGNVRLQRRFPAFGMHPSARRAIVLQGYLKRVL